LEVIEIDGFFTICIVDMTKDVKTGLYAPDFAKKIAVAQTKIEMMFLGLCK